MELNDYLAIVWRRRWIIAITTVVTVIVVAIGSFIMPPVYWTSTTLRVGTALSRSPGHLQFEINYTDRLMNTYAKVIISDALLGELTQRLGIDKPPKISTEVIANTELMRIIVEDQDATLAEI
jgi:capsular polysaccharide biosynthesis protein